MIVDQTSWGKLRLGGADRVRFLQGMCSNDVGALAVGGWVRAAVLNVKGRVLAVIDVLNEEEALLLVSEPATAIKVRDVLERHAIMDDVTFTPVESPCHRIWDDPASVWTAPPILADPPRSAASAEDVDVRRIEGGLPRYGVDVSEDYFPFEANLDSAISYTKGCYVGQEVVARAHARGQANKRLMGLRLAAPVSVGAKLMSAVRPEAGHVTSAVVSPAFGPIALAYVHKSSWEPGTEVKVGDVVATVTTLPFA